MGKADPRKRFSRPRTFYEVISADFSINIFFIEAKHTSSIGYSYTGSPRFASKIKVLQRSRRSIPSNMCLVLASTPVVLTSASSSHTLPSFNIPSSSSTHMCLGATAHNRLVLALVPEMNFKILRVRRKIVGGDARVSPS